MNTFVANPEWGWWIVGYFFLGGIAAGTYFTAAFLDLLGRAADREIAPIGYRIALVLILVCGLFLTLDLNRPERFWHMLFAERTVHEALNQGWPWTGAAWRTMLHAPHMKYWSPMSVGSWALLLFGLCSALSVLGSFSAEGRLAWLFRRSLFGKLVTLIGGLVGFFVGAYPGSLLTATNQPLWSDTGWLAPLFLSSAASTGIATLLLWSRWRGIGSPELQERLELADRWALVQELVVFGIFLASLGTLLTPVLQTVYGALFVGGTLVIGLMLPLTIHLRWSAARASVPLAAFAVLLGGFVLRWGILTTAPELLEQKIAWLK
jgi:formate-dependent nitrite reductase membrane component NrfD